MCEQASRGRGHRDATRWFEASGFGVAILDDSRRHLVFLTNRSDHMWDAEGGT